MLFNEKEKTTLIKAIQYLQANLDPELVDDFKDSGYAIFTDEYSLEALVSKIENHEAMSFVLKDDCGTAKTDVQGYVENTDGLGLSITLKGYSDCCSEDSLGSPIYIEKYDGEVRVRLYADINKEEPTHSVSIEGARNEKRVVND